MHARPVSAFTSEQGLFELTILNAEASRENFEDVFMAGMRKGIPPEILTRLRDIWDQTKTVGGEVISIGKIIVKEIVKFIKANP